LEQLKAVEQDQDDNNSGQNGYYDQPVLDKHGNVVMPNASGSEIDLGNEMGEMIDANEFSDGGIGMGGHATNLDGLDKEQIMKMIDQEVDGLAFEDQDNDVEGLEEQLEVEDDIIENFQQRENRGEHRPRGSNGEQHDSTIINSS